MIPYIGQLLDDRYELLEQIGTGGMAIVYRARDNRLNRMVAVKILKDEFSGDEEFRRRFRAESEAVAMLSHPNIVQVYDVSSSDSVNYIVMELVDGISLKQYMEAKGVLNWKETLHFAMQIAKGLEHAHSRGIVHRDIKPHNVMVLKNGSVKVTDFGIARVMNKSNTLTREALGSVHYISPEQAKGGYTDSRSDIYSLSVVMYEMMTGRPPYDGESPVAVAIQHINGGAPLPSTLNPNIPRGLEQIIMKGMALNVNDRYASATQLLQDMEEFRKNPDITFNYHTTMDDSTRTIHGLENLLPRNTAQKVAKAGGGSASVRTGNTGRTGTGGTGSLPKPRSETQRDAETLQRAKQRRQERAHREEERSRAAAAAVVVCSVVAIIAIVVFLVAIFNGALLGKEQTLVDVPYLVGTTYSDSLAEQYPDLTFRLQPQEYSDTYAKGQIMLQEPAGGSRVSEGTEIVLTVSMGVEPEVKVMENLINVTEEEAKSFLSGQGFNPLSRYENSSVYEEGRVIRTDPAAGTELKDGQTINLWISTGPKTTFAKMPNVVGVTKEEALEDLKAQGFTNIVTIDIASDEEKGTVVSQSEARNTEIDVNTEIRLEISEGPEPTTEATTEETTEATTEATESTGSLWDETENTMLVTFTIPDRDTGYTLTIQQNGLVIVGPTEVEAHKSGFQVELTGSGTQSYDLYIDGAFWTTVQVEFG